MKKLNLFSVFMLFLAAALFAFPLDRAPTAQAQYGTGIQPPAAFRALTAINSFNNRGTLTQDGAATFSSTVDIVGDTTVTGAFSTSATATAGTFMIFTPSTAITVTNGNPFTPTASNQAIQAAGTVTPTLAVTDTLGSAYTAGTLLRLRNISAQTINLADSGNVKLSAAWAAGQYDTLTLMFDVTTSTWIEIARSDN